MKVLEVIRRLEAQRVEVSALFRAVAADEMRWKPEPARWSMLEVLGHLLDEERDDFRPRIAATLAGEAWVPIDPEARVVEREHQRADPGELLAQFEGERDASVAWLRGLGEVEWDRSHAHPQLGEIRAGDLLVSWAAHDLLHLRQVFGLRVESMRTGSSPYSIGYAAP